MDNEMYSGMSCLIPASPIIERGIALHKMIHFITMALGGEGYLNFMGNEFGHPEWLDFPREGNDWSYEMCRRQWDLVDTDHLRYKFMNAFDRSMNALDDKFGFLSSSKQIVSSASEEDKVIVFERGDLVFVFNFHPENTYEGYKVGCDLPGKYRIALDSDAWEFGGPGRVGHDVDHFTSPEGIPGKPETNFNNRPNSFKVLSPPRTCVVYCRVDEEVETSNKDEIGSAQRSVVSENSDKTLITADGDIGLDAAASAASDIDTVAISTSEDAAAISTAEDAAATATSEDAAAISTAEDAGAISTAEDAAATATSEDAAAISTAEDAAAITTSEDAAAIATSELEEPSNVGFDDSLTE